jgi:hypothetical protein
MCNCHVKDIYCQQFPPPFSSRATKHQLNIMLSAGYLRSCSMSDMQIASALSLNKKQCHPLLIRELISKDFRCHPLRLHDKTPVSKLWLLLTSPCLTQLPSRLDDIPTLILNHQWTNNDRQLEGGIHIFPYISQWPWTFVIHTSSVGYWEGIQMERQRSRGIKILLFLHLTSKTRTHCVWAETVQSHRPAQNPHSQLLTNILCLPSSQTHKGWSLQGQVVPR